MCVVRQDAQHNRQPAVLRGRAAGNLFDIWVSASKLLGIRDSSYLFFKVFIPSMSLICLSFHHHQISHVLMLIIIIIHLSIHYLYSLSIKVARGMEPNDNNNNVEIALVCSRGQHQGFFFSTQAD